MVKRQWKGFSFRQPSTKKRPKVVDEWQDYKTKVLPPNCSHIQLQETRRAFYAGVVAALHLINKVSGDNWTEEEGAKALEDVTQECADFFSQVGIKY